MADYEAFTVAKENIEDERALIEKGKENKLPNDLWSRLLKDQASEISE